MNSTVTLMTGTDIACGNKLLDGQYSDLSWWSNDLETVAHYYGGRVIEIVVELDPDKEQGYVRSIAQLDDDCIPLSEYTYGFVEVRCPAGATWYSFNGDYLRTHIVSCREIYPDLREFDIEY